MKKISITIFILFVSYITFSQPLKVAIFDPAGNVPNDIKTIVREELSAPMVERPEQFEVLERAMIDQITREQKFQLSGEVDNNQISELGKKLGANYVCVSSITQMGKNYYIAVKLVAVATALVKKQVNQMTQHGIEDVYPTVQDIAQKLVAEFGSSSIATSTKRVTQSSSGTPTTMTYDEFKFQLQEEKESMLLENRFALSSYKKYKSYQTAGWWMLGSGAGAIVIGGVLMNIRDDWTGNLSPTGLGIGIPLVILGSASLVTGTVFLIAKPYLKTTYDYYLKGGTKQSLHFNFTPIVAPNNYGVGMMMRF